MPDVIYEMSRKGLGMTAVVEDSRRVVGIITDGDLRRLMQKRKKEALELTASEAMTRHPVTIPATELAAAALRLMEERKITSLLVTDEEGRLEGVVPATVLVFCGGWAAAVVSPAGRRPLCMQGSPRGTAHCFAEERCPRGRSPA
jgi:CBS domain-containing protein